jgi:hypothetical protein
MSLSDLRDIPRRNDHDDEPRPYRTQDLLHHGLSAPDPDNCTDEEAYPVRGRM